MPWDFALLLALLSIAVPLHTAREIRTLLRVHALSAVERRATYLLTIAFQWVATVLVIWRVEARGVTRAALGIALPEPGRAFAAAFVLTSGLVAYQLWSLAQMSLLPREKQGVEGELARKLMPQSRREWPVFAALTVTVALCEEFIFRGFAYAAIQIVIENPWAAMLGSSVLFSLAHAYQGARGMRTTFLVGLIFAAAREWSGSLAPVVLAHFATDFVVGVLAPQRLAATRSEAATAPATSAGDESKNDCS